MRDLIDGISDFVATQQATGQPLAGIGYAAGRGRAKDRPYFLMDQIPSGVPTEFTFGEPRVDHATIQFQGWHVGMSNAAGLGDSIAGVFDNLVLNLNDTDTAEFVRPGVPVTALDGSSGDVKDVYKTTLRYDVTINRNA